MESLFLYRDQGNRRKQFIRTYSDAIAGAASDDDGILLSSIALSDDYHLDDEEEASLADRGLIERKKDGTLKITETGMKAVSVYPLMGKKSSRKPYLLSFFPMLLSILSSGDVPSHHALYSRYLSSDLITGCFPSIDKENTAFAAVRSAEAMDELGMLRHDGGKLSMDRNTALSFFSLPLHDKLAYMMHPEADGDMHRKIAHAIYIIEWLSDYPEDEIGTLLHRISRITGVDLSDDMEMLFRFSVLYAEGGRISAFDADQRRADTAVISSDFTITSDGSLKAPVFLFAQPLKADISEQWAITRTSAKAAFSMGMSDKDIMKEIRKISSETVPDMVSGRISSWYGSFSSLRCMRALVISADDKNARVMDVLPTLQIHIVSKLSDIVFIMNPSTEEEWRKILKTAGFDMLGRTEGWELKEKESPMELKASSFDCIAMERSIPFGAENRMDMLQNADSALRRALIESGFILSPDTENPPVSMILGLYYQEKARLIASAATRNAKVYAEFTDGRTIIGRASKAEDPGHVIIDGEDVDIAKIWKTAELPLSVKSIRTEGVPSDSDSL